MREENKKKSESNIITFLTLINNRITSSILIYFVSILLIINAYILGGMISIKNRPDNSLYISDYNNSNNLTSSTTINTSQESEMDNKIIFGSSKGKYYYYKGCEATNLSPKNLVYYKSEVEAKSLGKILHSSCQ